MTLMPGRPHSGRVEHPARGFTLVELIVVVALISLFMALTIPMFGNIGTSSLDSSARRLSGTIKYLFNEAALSGLEYRLLYDLEQGTYHARVLEADGRLVEAEDQGRQAALKGSVRFRDVVVPGRGKFSMGQVTTRIDPSGWIEETIIHLDDGRDADGAQLTLRVMPLTGTTEIFSGYREFSGRR
ncbi:MAG TPA: prepilin-type N-terminal cleavage/methylation domain-containing protein [Desulfuromonadales bacterium]|nr:prepilin-type N-terminal cleavage/methylation domain-containing protein [Desulfuromonadales bacterium]